MGTRIVLIPFFYFALDKVFGFIESILSFFIKKTRILSSYSKFILALNLI
ncbi:MAG: hypothetical protein PARBA_01004 [Parabacteroides sp.]